MRAVFEMLGVQDVVAKSIGSQNPYNMIRATLDGLRKEASPRMVAQRRGKRVADILRKPEIAKSMERAFADNAKEVAGLAAETAAKTSRWLPDGMGFSSETALAEAVEPEITADTTNPDEPESLPAFMEDAA